MSVSITGFYNQMVGVASHPFSINSTAGTFQISDADIFKNIFQLVLTTG
jgi:hypothetical protein